MRRDRYDLPFVGSPPLPPHERTWRHPSEVAAAERHAIRHTEVQRSTRGFAIATGSIGLIAVGTLMIMVTPPAQDSPVAVSARDVAPSIGPSSARRALGTRDHARRRAIGRAGAGDTDRRWPSGVDDGADVGDPARLRARRATDERTGRHGRRRRDLAGRRPRLDRVRCERARDRRHTARSRGHRHRAGRAAGHDRVSRRSRRSTPKRARRCSTATAT